ncbi:MAG TPA: mannose-6-phosphate isomerase, class I [Microlunatus sp.]
MDPLTGSVQHYAWGSTTAIPAFLGVEPDGRPQAELWLGAHPSAPSRIGGRSLAELISADSTGVVGRAAVESFGPRLPYLLKVLAAAQPLSLQAHPSRTGAEIGFAREDDAGIDLGSPTRLYRDDWPKPEMLVALDDVEALCGFRDPDATFALFSRLGVPTATALMAPLHGGGADHLAEVFARVLGLTDGERDVVTEVVAAAAELLAAGGGPDAELERFARTAVELHQHYPGDPGVLAALLMNRMGISRFEGLFLPAGNLHAYLHGIGVEIMANSDNVMRGGLTPKHVDVQELMAILDFTPGVPDLVEVVADGVGVWRYRTPAPEFALWRLDADPTGVVVPAAVSGRVVLVVEGEVELTDGTTTLRLARGGSVFGYPGESLTVTGGGIVVVAAPAV